MKLWITAIALALLSACSPSASLLGSWRSSAANRTQTLTFNADGSYATLSVVVPADGSGCRSESAYESTYEASTTTLTMQPPSVTRDRVVGCSNATMNRDWQSTPVDRPPPATANPYRIENNVLTLGSPPNTTAWTRVQDAP